MANVYYSPVAGWKPSNDKGAVVVYVSPSGKTIGQTTAGNISSGIDTRAYGTNTTTGESGNIGTLLSKDIKSNTITTTTSGTGYDPATRTNLSTKQQQVLTTLKDKGMMTGDTTYSYGRVSSVTSAGSPTAQAYEDIGRGATQPFVISQAEAKANPNISSKLPVWVAQSPNTPIGMINAVNVESQFASVPVYRPDYGMPYSKGYFETNQAIIGQSMFKYGIASNPNLSNVSVPDYSTFQLDARKQFYKLPIATQVKLEGTEVFYGAVKFGEGTKKFFAQTNLATAFSMGRYDIKEGQVISGDISQTFTKLNVPTVPHIKGQNWFTELVTERPATAFQVSAGASLLYVAGSESISNVKQFGFKQGIGTSLAGFSPINLEASGGFDISKRLIEAPPSSKKVSFINQNGNTIQFMETKVPARLGDMDLGITIKNAQVSSPTGKGFGIQQTTAPSWTYRGGVLTSTQSTTKSLNLFQPSGIEGISSVTSISKGGIRSAQVSGVDQTLFKSDTFSIGRFASGEVGTQLIKTSPKNYIVESGFKTQFKGYSVTLGGEKYDISSFPSPSSKTTSFKYSSGGKTITPLSKTFPKPSPTTNQLTQAVQKLKAIRTPSIETQMARQTSSTTNTLQTKQVLKTGTKQIITTLPARQTQSFQLKSLQLPASAFALQTKTSTQQRTSQVQRTSLSTTTINRNILDTKSLSKYSTTTRTGLASIQSLSQQQATKQIFSNPTRTSTSFPSIPSSNPIIATGFAFPALPSFDFTSKTRKLTGKRKYKYTPSFEAFALGIKSKRRTPKYSKQFTGLETRPITKGFSFTGRLKF